jgi:hypothetical protein
MALTDIVFLDTDINSMNINVTLGTFYSPNDITYVDSDISSMIMALPYNSLSQVQNFIISVPENDLYMLRFVKGKYYAFIG